MLPYWLLFSLCAVGAIQYSSPERVTRRAGVLLTFAAITIGLMVGLRYQVGGDWHNYELTYEDVSILRFMDALRFGDPSYILLNWLAAKAGIQIWIVNLICGIIFTWGLIQFAKAQANPWLSLVVGVPYLIIVVAMGYTRQAVAIGLIMAAIAGMEKHSTARFLIYVMAAATFHKSAIIVLPLIGLAVARNRVLTGILLVAMLATLYLVVRTAVDDLLTNYVEAGMESQGAAIRVAMNLPPAIIFLLFQRKFGFAEVERKIWRNFALGSLTMLAMLLLTASSTAVDRIALYLIPLQLAVLARVPEAFGRRDAEGRQQRSPALLLGVIAYSAAVQFVWLNFAANSYYWIPYQFYPTAVQAEAEY